MSDCKQIISEKPKKSVNNPYPRPIHCICHHGLNFGALMVSC
jgi:hypothetical protein